MSVCLYLKVVHLGAVVGEPLGDEESGEEEGEDGADGGEDGGAADLEGGEDGAPDVPVPRQQGGEDHDVRRPEVLHPGNTADDTVGVIRGLCEIL